MPQELVVSEECASCRCPFKATHHNNDEPIQTGWCNVDVGLMMNLRTYIVNLHCFSYTLRFFRENETDLTLALSGFDFSKIRNRKCMHIKSAQTFV